MRGKCKIERGKNYHDDNPRVAAHGVELQYSDL